MIGFIILYGAYAERHNSLMISVDNFIRNTESKYTFKELLQHGLSLYIESEYISKLPGYNASINQISYLNNLRKEAKRLELMSCIQQELNKQHVLPIFFKGACLGKLLFDGDIYRRNVGDIDIYVKENDYYNALAVISKMETGLQISDKEADCEHHVSIVFKKYNNITVELHKNLITPRVGIKLIPSVEECIDVNINNCIFKTLDYTTYVTYLIYHLYMHIVDDINGKTINLLFYRTIFSIEDVESKYEKCILEIAMLIEKFNDNINKDKLFKQFNDNVVTNVTKRIFIKILKLLPEAIREEWRVVFSHILTNIHFTKNDLLVDAMNCLLEQSCLDNYDLIESVISKNVLSMHSGKTIILNKNENIKFEMNEFSKVSNPYGSYVMYGSKPKTPEDYSMVVTLRRSDKYLCVEYNIKDDIIIPNVDNEFLPYTCDCVGIMLFSSNGKRYLYRYIFALLELIDNKLECVPYNLLGSSKIDSLRPCECCYSKVELENGGYNISLFIPYSFFIIHSVRDFYVDIVGCDCDEKQQGRKTTFSLTSDSYSCFDPRGYYRVILA